MRSAPHKAQSPGPAELCAEQTKTNAAAILAPCGSAVNPNGHAFDQGEFRDLRDRFAKRGYSLQRTFRADDGRIHYIIMRRSRTCVLSHPHDVRAYLTQVEGKPV